MEEGLEKVGNVASEAHFMQFGELIDATNSGKCFLEVYINKWGKI